ncbi:uncharacterized protein LOC133831907 [Humulus lupulus]|uniref:uncharacterized protein LOC133831907 n=1 Tax=Humulus lupulus TaxID=3486 RepID=UPI002B417CEC|nr:uncharacterized protein LOC133831907 [Humulus lupulus]
MGIGTLSIFTTKLLLGGRRMKSGGVKTVKVADMIDKVTTYIEKKVPEHVNEMLLADFSEEDVKDNAIIGFEGLHCICKNRFGNGKKLALKLDMAKAYDKVESCFVEEVMLKLGYKKEWVDKIMRCVRIVSISFLINGSVKGKVIPNRELGGKLRGLVFGRINVSVSHLFFVNDSPVFMKANDDKCNTFKEILTAYSNALGQLINLDKSDVSFDKLIPLFERRILANLLNVNLVESHIKYLGRRPFVERNKKEIFGGIKDRVWKRLTGWKRSMFSSARKEVLIKAIIQAIQTYVISYFKFLKIIIQSLHGMVGRFWWGSTKKKRKIHWHHDNDQSLKALY